MALWVVETHGPRAGVFVVEQIGALALRGDKAGIDRWKAIAAQFHALETRTEQ